MDFDIEIIQNKYKFHKYECLKLSSDSQTYEVFKLSLENEHPEGYNIEPYRCKVHSKDKYLICVEYNGDVHKWSIPDF